MIQRYIQTQTRQQTKKNLQKDLDNLSEWSNKWQLAFNATKCKVMHIDNQNENKNYYMNDENIRVPLPKVTNEKRPGHHDRQPIEIYTTHKRTSQEGKPSIVDCMVSMLNSTKYIDENTCKIKSALIIS